MNTIAIKVGLFVLLTAVLAGYLIITFESNGFSKSVANYYVYFDDVSGLSKGADVVVKGVKAGKVDDITIEGNKVKVKIGFMKDITLYQNAKAYIKMLGLMGDKYIYIEPGSPEYGVLSKGGIIQYGTTYGSTDEAFNKVSQLVDNINQAIGNGRLQKLIEDIDSLAVETKYLVAENRKNIKKTVDNIQQITASLKETLPSLIEKMNKVADNLDQITSDNKNDIRDIVASLREITKTLKEKLPSTMDNINIASKEAKDILGENKDNIRKSLENIKKATEKLDKILAKIDKGKGTVGKLVNDDSLYNNVNEGVKSLSKPFKIIDESNLEISMYGEHHTGNKDDKAGISVSLFPKNDRYIYVGLLSNSNGSISEINEYTQNGTTKRETKKNYGILFDIQYARRLWETKYGNLWVRAGLKENTGAGGLDWWFTKNFRITTDIYKFNRKYETYGTNKPEFDAGIYYKFGKTPFFVKFGGSDLIAEKNRGFYIGGGLQFTDNYLKYMLGALGGTKP